MIWSAIVNAHVSTVAEQMWQKAFDAAGPEHRKEMLEAREKQRVEDIRLEQEYAVERRHRETINAIRSSASSHARSSYQPDNFLTGFLVGKIF